MSHYAYFRIVQNSSFSLQEIEQCLNDIAGTHPIKREHIILEHQSITDVNELPSQLMYYIDRVFTPDDTLITRTLHDLGNNTQQIAYVIQRCQSLGMKLLFLNDLGQNVFSLNVPLAEILNQLKNIEDNYEKMKLDRRHAIALQQGKILGRPEGSVYKQAIYEMRCKGYKQREVANHFNISLSTVKRYWKKRLFE
ncbi:helix-turn-helix domain-containing protein [Providencia sp. wls1943]|uniref:helix-turn-helix domain-containing protein n=1 Tax=Providencia sp. wls1943 TaxID=2675150 RepID=UPI0012B567FB|nr:MULTISPECIES: helix-turn-helix domain-containing protein [Providencia]